MPDRQPVAIVDIGSNSVRLVVYAGARRAPFVVFNEKVMAGLGRRVAETGALSNGAQARAFAALRRFRLLTREMGVSDTHVGATAAVREASNCDAFVAGMREIGFDPRILSGSEEGVAAGLGVISAFPDADGIVGDLGGGSLELVDVANGAIARSVSLPLGALRVGPMLDKGSDAAERRLLKAIGDAGFGRSGRGRPFYMVGGSWRALARLDMAETGYPLPIAHHYRMQSDRPAALERLIARLDPEVLKQRPGIQSSRASALPAAAFLLMLLVRELKPAELIVSGFGIREGILYQGLDEAARARDPLIAGARARPGEAYPASARTELLDRWIAPCFAGDDAASARLRHAACLLADVAWQANPDFRAERGVDMALHGNWVGIDGPGRVMLAQALFASFGGEGGFGDQAVASLCSPDQLARAVEWGLAIRLGQRLSGGLASVFERSRLSIRGDRLRLTLDAAEGELRGETVERRLKALAAALGLKLDPAPA